MNSVVSAAIIEGSLIIGLSDGSIINCGFVQGPQGLSGPQGPMGATGNNGTDGNTIITVAGTPGNETGSDGDYAIDNINWRIYGPRAGGLWGLGTPLRGNSRGGDKRRDTNQTSIGGESGSAFPPRVIGGTTYGSSFPANLRVGAQHVMSDTLYEYVYTGGVWMQIVGSGGGSGGATTLGALTDVNLSGTKKGDVFIATDNSTWENNQVLDGGIY